MSGPTYQNGGNVPAVRLGYLQRTSFLKARKLLSQFQAGDAETVAQFKKFHPSIDEGYEPTLTDAQVIVARKIFCLKELCLEKLKNDAKRLLKAIKNQDTEALLKAKEYHPKATNQSFENPKLADAQLILARENGLSSWAKLKKHIETMESAKQSLESKGAATDSDLKTLHIRCGNDIQEALKDCGFEGEFFEIRDPLPQGPISLFTTDKKSIDAYAKLRGDYIAMNYGKVFLDEELTPQSCRKDIAEVAHKLQNIPDDIERIVLWYEHDPYDQLSLSYVLYNLSIQKHLDFSRIKLEIIQVDNFPGTERFIGIGVVSQKPESLLALWKQRQTVPKKQISEYAENWQAYCSSSPQALWKISQPDSSLNPILKASNLRVLRELPNTDNGLSLTQQLALQIIHEHQPIRLGQTFLLFNSQYDPLTYFGDVMFFAELNLLIENSEPALEIADCNQELPYFRQFIQLTKLGRRLLNGDQNWLDVCDKDRWVGGTKISPLDNRWFWDNAQEKVIEKMID